MSKWNRKDSLEQEYPGTNGELLQFLHQELASAGRHAPQTVAQLQRDYATIKAAVLRKLGRTP